MSKKQLLEETTIRKFMKLANLEPLSDNFIKEELGYSEEEDMAAPEGGMEAPMGDEMPGSEEGELEVDLDDAGAEGEVSPGVAKKVIQAVMSALGVQGTVEDDEGMGDDEDAGEMDDLAGDEEADEEGEEEFGGEEEAGEEDEEEVDDEEEMEEARLSEDDLVENVLRRVTARLLAEAKKAKKGSKKEDEKDVKAKMKAKKAKKLDEEVHVKTHKKSSNVLNRGKNKHNSFKGVPDMEMTELKSGKKGTTGKGGHEMKPLKSTQKHTVTHDKTSKVTGKGGNKA